MDMGDWAAMISRLQELPSVSEGRLQAAPVVFLPQANAAQGLSKTSH